MVHYRIFYQLSWWWRHHWVNLRLTPSIAFEFYHVGSTYHDIWLRRRVSTQSIAILYLVGTLILVYSCSDPYQHSPWSWIYPGWFVATTTSIYCCCCWGLLWCLEWKWNEYAFLAWISLVNSWRIRITLFSNCIYIRSKSYCFVSNLFVNVVTWFSNYNTTLFNLDSYSSLSNSLSLLMMSMYLLSTYSIVLLDNSLWMLSCSFNFDRSVSFWLNNAP